MKITPAQRARITKALIADKKVDAKKGIIAGSARDKRIDASVRAKAMKGK